MSRLVSIVVPTYNSLSTLREALYSIASQTYRHLEVIVVDDGSGDGTSDYLNGLEFELPMRVISQPNSGAGSARNAGIDAATGEFVLFVDSDVILQPTMVERLVERLEGDSQAAFAYCDFETRADHGSWRPRFTRAVSFDASVLRQANYIAAVSLVRRELCPKWDVSLRALEDWDLWLTLVDAGHTGLHVPKVLFETIDREESITQTWDRNHHYECRAEVLAKHVGFAVITVMQPGAETAPSLDSDLGIRPPLLSLILDSEVAGGVGRGSDERPVVSPDQAVQWLARRGEELEYILVQSSTSPVDASECREMVRLALYCEGMSTVTSTSSNPEGPKAFVASRTVSVLDLPGETALYPAALLAALGWRVPITREGRRAAADRGRPFGLVNLALVNDSAVNQ